MIFELRQNRRRLGVFGTSMIGTLWAGAVLLGLPLDELDAAPWPPNEGDRDGKPNQVEDDGR